MIYAVIDTNVMVSAMLTHNIQSATFKVMEAMFENQIIPLYNEDIIDEYEDVLQRPKFGFSEFEVNHYLETLKQVGIHSQRIPNTPIVVTPAEMVEILS